MGGCQKQRRPSPGEIHAITKEFAGAVKATARADVRSEVSTSYQDSAGFDRINVTVRADSISSSRAVVYKLLRAMNGVATRHHLSRDGPLESREGLLYAYRRAGVITHMVHFHEKIDVNSTEAPPPQQNEAARQNETARLAIILDDLGNDRAAAAIVAYDTAQRCGVRSGFRNVPFLDDVAEVSAVRKQVQLALRDARKKGEAIAIGHPHPATLQALRDVLPDAKAQGVRLVFASEVVHEHAIKRTRAGLAV